MVLQQHEAAQLSPEVPLTLPGNGASRSLALSLLEVALLVGYAVEVFCSWLDDVIAASTTKTAGQEEAGD